jgi:hypothetical protein
MSGFKSFENFIKGVKAESVSKPTTPVLEADTQKTVTKKIKITFDIDWNENIGKFEREITLAMSPNSLGMYELAPDIEKYTGLPKKDAEAAKETPDDAFVYGMCNVMNGGKDHFFWTNGTRLAGAAKKSGVWPAIMEQVSHECVHLTRHTLAHHILEKKGSKDWVNDPWPSVGDDPKENLIDEEAFATAHGIVVQTVTNEFLKMASSYIADLKL